MISVIAYSTGNTFSVEDVCLKYIPLGIKYL
jgi:hypothetical protein